MDRYRRDYKKTLVYNNFLLTETIREKNTKWKPQRYSEKTPLTCVRWITWRYHVLRLTTSADALNLSNLMFTQSHYNRFFFLLFLYPSYCNILYTEELSSNTSMWCVFGGKRAEYWSFDPGWDATVDLKSNPGTAVTPTIEFLYKKGKNGAQKIFKKMKK